MMYSVKDLVKEGDNLTVRAWWRWFCQWTDSESER